VIVKLILYSAHVAFLCDSVFLILAFITTIITSVITVVFEVIWQKDASPLKYFFLHGHSFEQICTKFGTWHPYTLQMVMSGGELASAALVLSTPELAGTADRVL